jgi:hypothetical protein
MLNILPMASLLYLALVHSNLAFHGLAKAAMAFFGIALVSLIALHWRHCQHQAVLVAGIAPALLPSWPSKVRPVPSWRLPTLCWCFACIALMSSPTLCCCCQCQCCAGVIALVAWGLFPCCTGTVALLAFTLLPALQTGICPVMKQWQHTLASLPALRHYCCWRCAGIVALVARAPLPLLRWCCRPRHTRVTASIMNWHLPSHDAVATRCW